MPKRASQKDHRANAVVAYKTADMIFLFMLVCTSRLIVSPRFIQHNARCHTGIQRLHLRGLRDHQRLIHLMHDFARKTRAFIADEDS